MDNNQVTVTTTATRLDAGSASEPQRRAALLVRNRGVVAVYLGSLAVSSSNGFQLDPGEAVNVDLGPYGSGGLYGRTASSTARVDRLQVAH